MVNQKKREESGGPQTTPRAVRQQYTLLPEDVDSIETIRKRFQDLESRECGLYVEVTKSRVIRAGLRALSEMSDSKLQKMMNMTEKLPEGRRKQN